MKKSVQKFFSFLMALIMLFEAAPVSALEGSTESASQQVKNSLPELLHVLTEEEYSVTRIDEPSYYVGLIDQTGQTNDAQQAVGWAAWAVALAGNATIAGQYRVTVPVGVDMLADADKELTPVLDSAGFELFRVQNGSQTAERIDGFDVNHENGRINSFTFDTDIFGVYVLKYAAAFHYNGRNCCGGEGSSQILLSNLIEQLNIMNGDALLNVADVASVAFTEEHPVTVSQVSGLICYNNVTGHNAGDKDFLLTSDTPFTSEEQLTITLTNGEMIEVGMPAAETEDTGNEGTDGSGTDSNEQEGEIPQYEAEYALQPYQTEIKIAEQLYPLINVTNAAETLLYWNRNGDASYPSVEIYNSNDQKLYDRENGPAEGCVFDVEITPEDAVITGVYTIAPGDYITVYVFDGISNADAWYTFTVRQDQNAPLPVNAGEKVVTENVGSFIASETVPAGTELTVNAAAASDEQKNALNNFLNPPLRSAKAFRKGGNLMSTNQAKGAENAAPAVETQKSDPLFYEISLVGPNGEKVQAGASVTISTDIEINVPDGMKMKEDSVSVRVFHFDEDNNVTELQGATPVLTGSSISSVSFATTGFSLFAVMYTVDFVYIEKKTEISIDLGNFQANSNELGQLLHKNSKGLEELAVSDILDFAQDYLQDENVCGEVYTVSLQNGTALSDFDQNFFANSAVSIEGKGIEYGSGKITLLESFDEAKITFASEAGTLELTLENYTAPEKPVIPETEEGFAYRFYGVGEAANIADILQANEIVSSYYNNVSVSDEKLVTVKDDALAVADYFDEVILTVSLSDGTEVEITLSNPAPVKAGETVTTEGVGFFVATEEVPAGTELVVESNPKIPDGIVIPGGGKKRGGPVESEPVFFDISLVGPDGKEIQTGANVTITTDIALPEAPEGQKIANITVTVYHIDADNNVEPLEATWKQQDGIISAVSFTTPGFSLFAIVYTIEYIEINYNGVINLNFSDYEPYPAEGVDTAFIYDTDTCNIQVSVEAVLAAALNAEASGDGVASENAQVENFEIDLTNLSVTSAEGGVEYIAGEDGAAGTLVITADGSIELTDGEKTLTVNITGITKLSEEILRAEGVEIQVKEGKLPLGSEAQYTAHTDEKTAELVETYGLGEGEENIAGFSAADIKIVRNDEEVSAEGLFEVTLNKASLIPEGMKLDKLYHIHDGEVEELKDVEQTETGLVFEVSGFSDIVASYTVDFAYYDVDGLLHTWRFPGIGSRKIMDVLTALDIEAEDIIAVNLDLIDVVGEKDGTEALYLGRDDDGNITINSDMAFDDVYLLTVIADSIRYEITVTDSPPWTGTINLYDYDGTTLLTNDNAGITALSGKHYGIVAVVKNNGTVVAYNKAYIDDIATKQAFSIDLDDCKALTYNGSWWGEGETYSYNPGNGDTVEFRLYEASDSFRDKPYGNILQCADSMTGFEFLDPNGNVKDETNKTVTLNLKRAYDKQYNVRLNIQPAGLTISADDQYYAFITVDHQTTGTTYAYSQITVSSGQTVVDLPITDWYDSNGTLLPNEKFTGNETVTVQIYTTNMNSYGTKEGFSDINGIKNSQTKVLVTEGTSINRYNLYYGNRTTQSDDTNHITNYYDNLILRAPNGTISKGYIDSLLDDATDFGYYTEKYIGHSGDIEATIGAAYMNTIFEADFGYSSANVNVNRLKVLKIYTTNEGAPVSGKEVTIRLKKGETVVDQKTGTTDTNGRLEFEFDGLASGDYDIEEIINGEVVHGNGNAQIEGETVYYNFSIDKAHFVNNVNVNYFGTLGDQDTDRLIGMLQKASRVDVVILVDDETEKAKIEAALQQGAGTYGSQNIEVYVKGTNGYKSYDIVNDMVRLRQLSDDLASAQSSNTVRIVNVKASEIPEDGMAFDDDGRYIVLNIEMDQQAFCPRVLLDGQLLDADYGQSGKSNSSRVLYNLRSNGSCYGGLFDTTKVGAGIILAPSANAHILGGPFGGTIITYQVNRQGNELHSNNPNQIQTLNATIHNVIGGAPTTGSLELRKLFANSAIKDKITYFTFEVTLTNADLTKVANQTFPASGLKQGNTVTFDAEGKALVLVRAGNSVTIADLPDGTTYTVTEVTTPETEHFIFDSIHTTEDNGTIVAGKTQSAKIYNNLKTADLTIVKEVTGTTDDSKLFEFTLELENNTAAANETAVWQPYPDAYTISIVGGETISVPAGQGGSQTIKLKAGQRAEITGLKDNDKVLRYTVTEVAVWINGVRNAISTQPFYGYSTDDLVQEGTYTESGTIVSFVNNYKAETKVKLVAKKVLQGRELAANEFTFELRANSPIGPVIGEQKTNAADGTVTFDDIEYKIDYTTNPIVNSMAGAIQKEDSTRENTFTYYICEVNTNDTSVAYADPIQVKVKVVDDGLGNLRAYDEEGNLITEYNNEGTLTNYTYTLPESKDVVNNVMIEKTLEGTKTMTGRDMEEGEVFEFIVKENNVEVARGTATGGTNGTPVAITFPPMVYAYDPDATYPVTHIYTITEDNTKLFDDVQANSQVFYAKVEVTYNSSTHEMTATGPEYSSSADGPWSGTSNIAFENTGETIGFSVTKDWKDQEDQAVLNVASVTLRISRKDGKPFVLKASQWINSNGKGTVTNVTRTAASLTEYELYMIAHGNMEDPTKQNLLKLEPDGTGWPVVQFTNLPETTYVVEEVECKLNNENAAVETVYALNSSADVAAAPDITADGDSLVVKNTETSNNLKVTKNFVLPNGNSANDIASKDSIYFAVRLHHSEDGSWWTYYNNGSATTMVNSVPLYEITWDATNQKWNTVTIGPIPETYAVSNDYNAPVLSYSVVEMTAEGAEKTTDAHLLGIKYIKNYGRTNEEVTRIEQGQGATITIENEIPEPRHLTVTKQWLDTYGELISGTPGQDKNITFKLKAKSAYGLVDVNSLDENNAIQKKLKELLNATYTLTGTCGADGHFTWTTQSFDDLPSTYDGTNWVKYFVEEISPSGMMVSYILEDGSVVNADHPHDPAQSGNITMTNKPEDSEGKIKVRKVWDGVSESDKKPVQVKIYRKSLTESSGAPVSKIGVTVNVGYGYNNYCQGPENSTIDSGYLTPGAIAEITSNYPVVGVYRSDNGIPLTVTNNQFEVPNDDVIIVISNWKTDGVTVEVNETVENPDQVWATINLSGNTTPAWEGTAAVPVKNGYVYYAQEVDAEGFDVSYSYTDSTGVSHSGETSMTSGIVNGVITVTNTRTETPKGSVKVTKVFDGLTSDQFPAGFQITNVINDTVFGLNTTGGKVAPTGGSGTTADPYYWQIDDLDVGTVVTFTETGLDVTGYDVSVIANSVASESPSLLPPLPRRPRPA
ncbi:MAG: hypothetical protein IKH57_02935 [Clostridia bacterium]|nr:hypothetical protein [Clostridia bacterium]